MGLELIVSNIIGIIILIMYVGSPVACMVTCAFFHLWDDGDGTFDLPWPNVVLPWYRWVHLPERNHDQPVRVIVAMFIGAAATIFIVVAVRDSHSLLTQYCHIAGLLALYHVGGWIFRRKKSEKKCFDKLKGQ